MSQAGRDHDRQRMSEIRTQSERNLAKLDEKYKSLKEQVRTRHEKKWTALGGRWRDGMQHVKYRALRGAALRCRNRPPLG